jgi:glutamine amidotransferase
VKLAIVDYGSGNLRSAAKAFERAARESGLKISVDVTGDVDTIARADRVVLPGVGAFRDCLEGVSAIDGMVEAISHAATVRQVPFFGICVGMQLMASLGREHGDTKGFGWIPSIVEPLVPSDPTLKIPHMGWNALGTPVANHPVLAGTSEGAHVYFVHSFALQAEKAEHVLATVDYGGPVTAMVGRDNIVGTQFHPEKSQAAGLVLIANFLKWEP